MIATTALALTADRKELVELTDKRAAFFVCSAGRPIPQEYQHLVKGESAPEPQPAPSPSDEQIEGRQKRIPKIIRKRG